MSTTKRQSENDDDTIAGSEHYRRATIFARTNRGILLDVVMFVANLFLMNALSGYFLGIYRQTSDEDKGSQILLGICCVAMMLLPTLAAILKRWHYHQRMDAQGGIDGSGKNILWGCLCNPIFYFCLNIVLMAAIMTVATAQIFGEQQARQSGAISVGSIILGTVLVGIQTFLVYRYFSPPKNPPRLTFLRDRKSEMLGDVFVYVNMALFQAAWNLVTFMDLDPASDVTEFAGRLFFLCFIALLVYFPPRIFYLAEDINRPRAWLTMLLANSPVIVRVLFGVGTVEMISW